MDYGSQISTALIESLEPCVDILVSAIISWLPLIIPIVAVIMLIEIAIVFFKHFAGESDRAIKAAFMDEYDLDDVEEIDWETLEFLSDNYFYYDLDSGEYIENDFDDEEDE